MSLLAQKVAETGDTSLLEAVDAWWWSYANRIKLQAGVFQVTGHEYQVDILQDQAPRRVDLKATQLGMTQVYVLLCLHSLIYGRYPQGIMYLFHTKEIVEQFAATRFNPLISENHHIIGKFVKKNSTSVKQIGKSWMYFKTGRLSEKVGNDDTDEMTSTAVRGQPCDVMVYDEYDLMDPGIREMGLGRMAHSDFKHEFFLSNPSIPDYGVDRIYHRESDQKKWHIKCDHCGTWTCLEIEFPDCLIRRTDGSVFRACKKCRREIFPCDGQWVAGKPDRSKDFSGRQISQLNSLYVNPKELLDAWESPELDKPNFYRFRLGMAYIEATDKLTKEDLYNCIGPDVMFRSHVGPCAMGIDVGKNLHVVVMDKLSSDMYRVVFVGRFAEFEEVYDAVRNFGIGCCVIDAEPETRKAKEWGSRQRFQVYTCDELDRLSEFQLVDTAKMHIKVHRTQLCDKTHMLVTTPGKFIIPRRSEEIDEFITEMCNIAKIQVMDKITQTVRYRYIKTDSNDHYRHATNFAYLACQHIGISQEGGRFKVDYVPKRRRTPYNVNRPRFG